MSDQPPPSHSDFSPIELVLHQVRAGELSIAEALDHLRGFKDLGVACYDLTRQQRTGLPEVVYGEGKQPQDLARIVAAHLKNEGRALVTRLDQTKAAYLSEQLNNAGEWHAEARVWRAGRCAEVQGARVAVVAAGTSDRSVAEEAAVCGEWFGLEVARHYDLGIAGLHRLTAALPALRECAVIIAVAGMDGALPTVLAGLVRSPVVAVPTSVGYGAAFAGVTPLLTMLTACAPGIGVVNIDNGFGAAALAYRILAAGSGSTNIASP